MPWWPGFVGRALQRAQSSAHMLPACAPIMAGMQAQHHFARTLCPHCAGSRRRLPQLPQITPPALPSRPTAAPQWCDTAPPQWDSQGVDYCAPAKAYADVDLSVFENLVEPPY